MLRDNPLVVGNMGAGCRLDSTVIGRGVNGASRIERPCEELGTPLLDRGEHALRGVGLRARL